jgi:hypothetical protein
VSKPPLPNTPENQTLGVKLAATSTADCSLRDTAQTAYTACLLGVEEQSFAPLALLLCRSCHSGEGPVCATARRGLKPVRRLCFNRLTDDPIHVASLIRALGSCHATLVSPHKPSLDVSCMYEFTNLYHVHVCTYHVSWIMSSRNKARLSVPVDPTLRTNEGLVPDRQPGLLYCPKRVLDVGPYQSRANQVLRL